MRISRVDNSISVMTPDMTRVPNYGANDISEHQPHNEPMPVSAYRPPWLVIRKKLVTRHESDPSESHCVADATTLTTWAGVAFNVAVLKE